MNNKQNIPESQALKKEIYKNLFKAKDAHKQPAFLFDRVSTTEQALTGLSLQYQSNFGQAYADGKNLYIVHSFEVAESGRKDTQRKYFKLMLELAIDLDIKHLIFKSVDRMSRNYKDLSAILDLIEQYNFTIHFYQQNKAINNNSTHDEKFMIGIEQAVAKHLSDKISHDTKQTNLYKAQRGIYPIGSNRHYGYRYDLKEKKWIIDQEEKEIVIYIFSEIAINKSLQIICDALNAKGIRSSRGGRWNKSSLHKLVTNPFYMGKFNYQNQIWPGNHEPYLTVEQFEEIQVMLGNRNIAKPGREFLLKGFIYFQDRLLTGGYKTGANNSGEYIYYSCPALHANFRENDIFNAIGNTIKEVTFDLDTDKILNDLLQNIFEEKEQDTTAERKRTIYRIGELEKENNKLLQALIDGYDPQTVKNRMNENRRSIELLEKEKNKLNINIAEFVIDIKTVINRIKCMPAAYQTFDKKTGKADFIKRHARGIRIYSEDRKHVDSVEIIWLMPLSSVIQIKQKIESINKERVSLPENSLDAPSATNVKFLNDARCIPEGI